MKKSLDDKMDAAIFHLNKAEELVREWWEQREAMGRSMMTMDESTDFFVEVAAESVRTERRYISQIKFHRNKAKRILRRYDKKPLKTPDFTSDMDVPLKKETPLYDVASLYPQEYKPFPESDHRN